MAKQRTPGPKKRAEKGMMSVYPPFDVAGALGGYRSVPFTTALRIAAQVLGDAAIEVAKRFAADEWEVLRVVLGPRQWEPEALAPQEMLADAVERAQQRTGIGRELKAGKEKDADKRIEALAAKLRECDYLDAWAIIIAVIWRGERDDVAAGDPWWEIAYRARKIQADKQEEA